MRSTGQAETPPTVHRLLGSSVEPGEPLPQYATNLVSLLYAHARGNVDELMRSS